MTGEQLYALLGRQPFQPVRVVLKDGKRYEILDRQMAIVGSWWVDIGLPDPDYPLPIVDEMVMVKTDDIERVEDVQNRPPRKNGRSGRKKKKK
jgi:hypothetical protein